VILDTNSLSAVAEEHKAAVAELAKAQFIAIPVIVLVWNRAVPTTFGIRTLVDCKLAGLPDS